MNKRLFSILALCVMPLQAFALTGRIVGITDGDTVKLLTSDHTLYKIRLAGIDAPEHNQPFGQQSKKALSDCAFDKQATVDTNKKDRYGRSVGKIIVNGTDCNLRQIKLGMAWHYKKYENDQEVEDRSTYAQAEYQAQSSKAGLWSQMQPQAPWEFRKMRRANKSLQ